MLEIAVIGRLPAASVAARPRARQASLTHAKAAASVVGFDGEAGWCR